MGNFSKIQEIRARKIHRCDTCGNLINTGEYCLNLSGCYDNSMYSDYICMMCRPVWEQFLAVNRPDEYSYNDVWQDVYDRSCSNCPEKLSCKFSPDCCLECKKARETYLNMTEMITA